MTAWNPNNLVKAAKTAGVTYAVDADWLTGPDPYGKGFQPVGIIWHHTGCNPLSRGNMPSLNWCRHPGQFDGDAKACHILLGRDGTMQIIAGKGAYHAGAGGPLKVNGTVIPRDLGNRYLIGVEIEASSSTKINATNRTTPKYGLNPIQVEVLAKYCAALFDELDWDTDAAIRHQDWAPGRKTDVGIPLAGIRAKINSYRKSSALPPVTPAPKPPVTPTPTPTPTPPKPKPVVKPSVRVANVQPTKKNNDVKILQQALKKEVGLTITESSLGTFNAQTKTAYKKWQTKLGYTGKDADGIPGKASLTALGKKHGFTVKTP